MGKKVGLNSKAEEAKSRKELATAVKKAKESKEKEDSQWVDDGVKGGKSVKKKEEEAEKKAEAARRKAELKKLAEDEEREIEKIAKKGSKPSEKVTAIQLAKMKEKEHDQRVKASVEAKKKNSRLVDESEYDKIVSLENTNRVEALVDARSLDAAFDQMVVGDSKPVDSHPEKRMKAAFKAFEESELPILKAERPGLTLTQYKEVLWKSWKKSPQNPLNQASGSAP